MTSFGMQQGAGGGGSSIAQEVQAEVQRELAAQREEIQEAAVQARAQAQGAQPQPEVRIGGPDGPLVIRDPDGRETVIIEPGAIPPWIQDGPPEGVFMIPIALFASIAFVIVGLPIARAFARRMDRKGGAAPVVAPSAELRQLQTSIDAMAVEIERMSEHQRFLTRVLAEPSAESLPAARANQPATRP